MRECEGESRVAHPGSSHLPGSHGHSGGQRGSAPIQGPTTSTDNTDWGSNPTVVVASAWYQADSSNVKDYMSCSFLASKGQRVNIKRRYFQ